MMLREYATSLLIWASLLIGEVHTFWEGTTKQVSFTISKYTPMNTQWAVKYITDEVWFLIIGVAILMYRNNRINRTSALAYLAFCGFDVVLFFYDFKQNGELYQWNYLVLLVSWILIYNNGTISSRTTERQGIIAKT